MKQIIALCTIALLLLSCNEDNDDMDTAYGSLNLVFENTVASSPLTLNTQTYANLSGEGYSVSELKYIISNIQLTRSDNTVHTIPVDKSYFVINEAGIKTALLDSIPVGDYTGINFGFGVDPTRYPIESGSVNFIPTAEEAGMLWTWSAGYKFLKFEGTYSTTVDTDDANPFTYHVGSHGANLDNYKEINLAFAKAVTASSTTTQIINFDVAKIFDSTNTMSLVAKDDIQVDPENAPKIAENVRTAFSIE